MRSIAIRFAGIALTVICVDCLAGNQLRLQGDRLFVTVVSRNVFHAREDEQHPVKILDKIHKQYKEPVSFSNLGLFYKGEKVLLSVEINSSPAVQANEPIFHRRNDGKKWFNGLILNVYDIRDDREVCGIPLGDYDEEYVGLAGSLQQSKSIDYLYGTRSKVKIGDEIDLEKDCKGFKYARGGLYRIAIELPMRFRNVVEPTPRSVSLRPLFIFIGTYGESKGALKKEEALVLCRKAMMVGKSDRKKKEDLLRKSLKISKEINCAKVQLLKLYEAEGRYDKAVEMAKSWVETAPEHFRERENAKKTLYRLLRK